MIAWHFLAEGSVMRDGRIAPADGVKLVHTGDVIPCSRGLHASAHPFDALQYAPGPVLCLVECGGIIKEHGSPVVDKLACSERTIIARMDATPLLRWFARMQALSVAHLLGDAPPDVVLDYLMTGDKSIRAAARAAAWAAARAAAWAAARDAARDAAWDAALLAAAAIKRLTAAADFAALVHEAFEDWL